ncbi:hypothetical protein [Seonamhaeicola maritimus]|uniref:Anti-sigma factor n=1 Tax=Seonamhaeicola maritimus TaxID=2591822 RepID=A0A5C7GNB6_9FLAO|nr:hypothetical protein [Seonamhaeicola maritimus]TXG39451.1 hypothetical protein FUA22_06145 [Seonamhaeicola maritimus]
MSNDNIEKLFSRLENEFDIEHPDANHSQRFLDKLNNQGALSLNKKDSKWRRLWKPLVGVAATVALLATFVFNSPQEYKVPDLASISPEMAETESIFLVSLTKELENLNSEKMPEYQELIVDALFEIKLLEENYKQLIIGLKENPNDELVLSAMILNFQKRIDVLEETKDKIEELKQTNTNQNII